MRIPEDVLEPLPAGLWQPFMWAYCEGQPIGFALLVAIPGPLIVRTWMASIAGVLFFLAAWLLFRALGAWDPRAYRVFKRARRYKNLTTAMLPSRASWGSPRIDFAPRRH